MVNLLQEGAVDIGCVRLRGPSPDPLLAQLRVSGLLNGVCIHPRGLPPAAICCIHAIRAPLPGRVWSSVEWGRSSREWQDAIAGRIEQLAARAIRPAHNPVPNSGAAVLFADRSELLACLAIDWLAGELYAHWWWQALFHSLEGARSVARAWIDAPAFLPAALQHLTRRGRAYRFVRALDGRNVRTLLHAIVREFGLHEIHTALGLESDHPLTANPTDAGEPQPDERQMMSTTQSGPPADRLDAADPWRVWVPECASVGNDAERKSLLGIGLMLDRVPAVVRSRTFAQAIRTWRTSLPNRPKDGFAGITQKRVAPPARAESIRDTVAIGDRSTSVHDLVISNHAPPPKSATPENAREPNSSADEDLAPKQAPLTMSVEESTAILVKVETIQTELGGLFYLANLGLSLNLYSDFTKPLEPGLGLPFWDFIQMVGRHLLGDQLPLDPVWGLLERLAGRRSGEKAGQGFEPPDEWRIPSGWLAPFKCRCVWTWWVNQRRLHIRHPAGFTIVDVVLGDHASDRIREETSAYASACDFELRSGEGESAENLTRLDRWRQWLLPFIDARLRLALGLQPMDNVAALLLKHHARIELSTARLDIRLSLDELPIAIRIAGLDRDPGWVPAAGRFIVFHFE